MASAFGWISPAKISQATQNIAATQDALPGLLNALTGLLSANGPLLVFAGAVWAFIKRRSEQKIAAEGIRGKAIAADAEMKIIEAGTLQAKAKKALLDQQMKARGMM
jgi:hypothetical protein